MRSPDHEFLPLLQTKLYRPPVTPDLEPRTRLIEHLERNRQRPLTLISAPAGYGKTMLASMWLECCGCPSGWVSLDDDDNDLHTFIGYFLAALSSAFPSIKLETQSLLDAAITPSMPFLARYLLNDLDQIKEPFILVLDDIHHIDDQSIFDLLAELLEHPSLNMNLVLIGRHDPKLQIASLRAHSKVTEVRAWELRFTVEETTRLLQRMLNRDVDQAIAADWAQKTEGWVTALRLAILSLRHRGKEQDLWANIQGDSRYLQDYLLAEVLGYLPDAKQAWILKSAVLDRFCAPLCEAVCRIDTDPTDLTGEKFINRLNRENLFVMPLDERGEWFRFHNLFQQLLYNLLEVQLNADEIAALRRRASHWFAENGLVDEGLLYALAAGDVQSAIHLVEQNRYQLINAERWNQLSRWIELFPDEVVDNDPILAITKAHLPSSYGDEAARMLSRANQLVADLQISSPVVREVKGEIAYCDSMWSILAGPAAETTERANEALALLPQQAVSFRSSVIGCKALSLQCLGDYKQGVNLINETLDDLDWTASARAKLITSQSYVHFFEGDLEAAHQSASKCLKIAINNRLWHTISEIQYLTGISHYLRNETDMAEPHLLALVEQRMSRNPIFVTLGVCALTRIYQAQQQPEMASETLGLVFSHLEELGNTFSLEILRAFQVELALDQGDLAKARHLSQSVDIGFDPPIWYHYVPQLTLIKLWLAEGSDSSLEKALTALERLNQKLIGLNRKTHRIEVQALLALVHEARDDQQRAGESLIAALRLGKLGGFIRTFADLGPPMASLLLRLKEQQSGREYAGYLEQILAAFSEEELAEPAGTRMSSHPLQIQKIEPLTRRERQVLQLLAGNLPMQEIADELVISPNTLHTHTKNIYAKMGVNRRAEAVQKARELGLV